METEKKQKVFRILKKIGVIITIIIGMIILGNQCGKKTKALENVENYNIYSNVGEISTITNSYGLYYITFENDRIYYNYENGNYQNEEEYTHYTFIFDSAQLENEIDETLKIDMNELQSGTIILFGGIVNSTTEEFYIDRITTLTRYLDKLTTTTYDEGATSAYDTAQSTAYNKGVEKGIEDTLAQAQETINQNNSTYETQIKTLQDQIDLLETTLNRGGNWVQLKNVLGLIFTYPIRFFKEGMDVEIYGVNIGGLLIGIGMIGITLSIIGMILGRKMK